MVQPESTPKPPHKRRRWLSSHDVEAIAELIGKKKLNDTEACQVLDIKPDTWFRWKSKKKNEAGLNQLLARVRGATIQAAMERIEAHGVKDWRADLARLSLIDRERFSINYTPQQSQATLMVLPSPEFNRLLTRVYARPESAQVIDVKEVKSIKDAQ